MEYCVFRDTAKKQIAEKKHTQITEKNTHKSPKNIAKIY